jgi:hypothetical protein
LKNEFLSGKQTLKQGEKMPNLFKTPNHSISLPGILLSSTKPLGKAFPTLPIEPNATLLSMDASSAGERLHPILRHPRRIFSSAATAILLAALGCASPGPPRAPSLGLPEPVRDLTASRIGNTVELKFTAPSTSTDKLPLRDPTLTGQLCRQLDHQPCLPIPASLTTIPLPTADTHTPVIWTDTLPPDLTQGPPHLLTYRVEFFSRAHRSAGLSAPAFTAAGAPPAPVDNLHAEGSRLGIVLSWTPTPTPAATGNVVLQREDLAPSPAKTPGQKSKQPPPIQWLGTRSPAQTMPPANRTLDTTAPPSTPFRYIAERRLALQLGTHPIELRSTPSSPVTFTLQPIYPPPAPTGVSAVGYFANGPAFPFAVDIIWQPTDETGLITPLAGYNLYREPLTTAQSGQPARLNPTPIRSPAFHDTTANPATRYRYIVTAVDTKGNESPAATTLLEPSTTR